MHQPVDAGKAGGRDQGTKGWMDGWVGRSVSECKVKFNILPASSFLPSPPKGKLAGWRDQKSYPGPHSRLTLGTAASGRSRERERNSWEEAPHPLPVGGGGCQHHLLLPLPGCGKQAEPRGREMPQNIWQPVNVILTGIGAKLLT